MSYFLDYVRTKVELRRENLDLFLFFLLYFFFYYNIFVQFLKGSQDNEKKHFSTHDPSDLSIKMFNTEATLIKRFKVDGFDYEIYKFQKILSYRDIEKSLISFQAYISVIFNLLYY